MLLASLKTSFWEKNKKASAELTQWASVTDPTGLIASQDVTGFQTDALLSKTL